MWIALTRAEEPTRQLFYGGRINASKCSSVTFQSSTSVMLVMSSNLTSSVLYLGLMYAIILHREGFDRRQLSP